MEALRLPGQACWPDCHFIGNPWIDEHAAPFFKTLFDLTAQAISGTLHICGLGYFEAFINGDKIGDSLLTPSQSAYDKTVYYCSFDIAGLVRPGRNELCVLLGNGLYNCTDAMAWMLDTAHWRDRPKLLVYGSITTADGLTAVIRSGRSFVTGESRITYNMLYGGETQDMTLPDPIRGDAPAREAAIVRGPGGVLVPMDGPYVRECERYQPVSRTELSDGRAIYDFGQNLSGWVRVTAKADAWTRLTLRYAEILTEQGMLDLSENGRFAKNGRFQQDEYILDERTDLRGARPHFTYHGFRYVELTVTGTLSELSLEAVFVHTDVERIGQFICSDETINAICRLSDMATLSNLVNIPTDCPHREKNGWTGDAALSADQMCLNFNMSGMFTRWLGDIRDAQRRSGQLPGIVPSYAFGYNWGSGPAWDNALFALPMAVYIHYGDSSLLLENYDAMKRYLEFCGTMAVDGIVGFGLGDWCPPSWDAPCCPEAVTDTAYYYSFARILEDISRRINRMDDAADFAALAERIKAAFTERFIDRRTGLVANGTQTAQACPVYFGLVEGELAQKCMERLVERIRQNDGALDFGILGSKYVFEVLSRYGYTQLAFDMVTRQGFPSYRHWLDMGATTMFENWNGGDSRNHHMFSDVVRWFYERLAGLNPPDFGRKTICITPGFPVGMTFAEAYTCNPAGRFACRWEAEADSIRLTVCLPDGYRAEVIPPPGWRCGLSHFTNVYDLEKMAGEE